MKINFKNIAFASTLLVGALAFSQQIDNNGFENWENVGSDNEEPIEWNSFHTASGAQNGFAVKTVSRSTTSHTGTYAAKIETVSGPFSVTVNGNMTCGQVNMGSTSPASSNNHNATRTGNSAFHHTFTTRPDSMVLWVNYAGLGGDNGSVSCIIHDNFEYKFPESGTSADHAIAYATTSFSSTGGWQRLSIPFDYNSGASSNAPEFILINCTPSAVPGGGTIGSILYVDDIEMIYNPIITTSNISPLSYTVTNTVGDNIDIPFTLEFGPMIAGNIFTAQLSDATGNFGAPTTIGTLTSTTAGTINAVIPAGTSGGSGYRVRVVGSNPANTIGTDNGQNINIDLIGNSIAPTGSQSLLIGVDGNILSVTENPAASSREWKYTTTSGAGYLSFVAPETGVTYTPNFISAGTYYVICESVISGDNIISNEVQVNVGAATITTEPINPTLFEFSPSSPNGNISVNYSTSGAFTAGNVFSVELSDNVGSFASSTIIGSVSSTTAGTISAVIPNTTLEGVGYRIRVVGSNPVILGSDNGSDLEIRQFSNDLSPSLDQNLVLNQDGSTITVTENQTILSRVWQYSTVSGSGYVNFSPSVVGAAYTPNFDQAGTFYVICKSTNIYNDEVSSNEVIINVANGTAISTSTVFGSPINLSPSAIVNLPVNFTSNASFQAINVFTAELSDAAGDFSSPTVIGTLNGSDLGPITTSIPVGTPAGTGYKIRVTSSFPAITGTECDNDIIVDQFSVNISGAATQSILPDTWGSELLVNESQVSSREWMYTTTSGSGYAPFTMSEMNTNYFPRFSIDGTYYIVCESTNIEWNDTVLSNELIVIVDSSLSVSENDLNHTSIFSHNNIISILSDNDSKKTFSLYSSNGQQVMKKEFNGTENHFTPNLNTGIYIFQLNVEGEIHTGKIKL